jgi:magnesium-transporting ATPase (P-type)
MKYHVLAMMPFTSSRRRMGVVVRMPDKTTRLYCKGADSVLLPLCKGKELEKKNIHSPKASKPGDNNSCKQEVGLNTCIINNLDILSKEGLRTLVMCTRELNGDEYKCWEREYKDAECAVEDRARKIEEAFARLERGLELVGCTGVEDRLQEGCAETVDFFVRVCGRWWW